MNNQHALIFCLGYKTYDGLCSKVLALILVLVPHI